MQLTLHVRDNDSVTVPPSSAVVSTALADTPGGAPLRSVTLTLRDDVLETTLLEGNEAVPACFMHMIRYVVPLRLPGGSAQLLAYALVSSASEGAGAAAAAVGRLRPLVGKH